MDGKDYIVGLNTGSYGWRRITLLRVIGLITGSWITFIERICPSVAYSFIQTHVLFVISSVNPCSSARIL